MSEQAFGEFLVTHGALSAQGLRRALEAQQSFETRLGSVLLDLGLVSEHGLLKALGRYCSSRTVSARELQDIKEEVVRMVPPRVARRHEVVPFRLEGKTLSVATIDPQDLLVEDELGVLTDCKIASYVANEVRLEQALARHYGKQLSVQMASLLKRLPETTDTEDELAAAAGLGTQPTSGTDELTDVVARGKRKLPHQEQAFRPGAARTRDPDETMVVEVSADELADFPSLRTALDDSGTGKAEAAQAPAEVPSSPPAAEADRPPAPAKAAQAEDEKSTDATRLPTVEDRLEAAGEAMQKAEMREDIADAILEFCTPYLRRRLLMAVREGVVMGWRGEGEGIDPLWVRSVEIPLDEPSVFVKLADQKKSFLGALPPMPGNQELLLGLGGEVPPECVILPLVVRDRTIGFLYGDNLDRNLEGLPVEAMRRLAIKAGLAFQVYMLKSKIRMV